ncbi:MAG TPA: hypothetical protein VMF58_13555 [Rhizomicrobium sp.]|nr:hypothetical protein [Rhizomicrobium sp.]
MITLSECATMCVLDHEDVVALAELEHLPEIAEATLKDYVANAAGSSPSTICKTMIGDIRNALDEGFVHQATEVVMALRQFLTDNPQAAPGVTVH